MATNSKIEWCSHTFNPWRGCTKVSAGCQHCYAETLSGRNPRSLGVWGPRGTRVVAAESYWREPLKWDKAAANAGERHRVFCASLADVFGGPDTMPASDWPKVQEARRRLFDLICRTPHLDWLLLTKRPQNALQLMVEAGLYAVANPTLPCPQPNLWIGTSVEDQAAADERVPKLLQVPAAVRFLSCEPLLGAVDLPLREGEVIYDSGGNANDQDPPTLDGIDWVIAGGESGPGARPMHPTWVRTIRDQCVAAGVPFLFKQWGEWCDYETAGASGWVYCDERDGKRFGTLVGGPLDRREFETRYPWNEPDAPCGPCMVRVGKKAAGRLLDGREWNEFPSVEVNA